MRCVQPFDIEPGADIYGSIGARGARENSRRDVSLDIPKRKLTVFTGVSGSGKSSLVFGTIAAESQRLINQTYTAFPVIHAESRPARRRLADQPRRRSSSTKNGWGQLPLHGWHGHRHLFDAADHLKPAR